mmetsp:Transcript_55903/g.120955  ORF Transcript_55903/g.120955 Transcript_55903/m.120955 type:complete len:435 (+) Transcript_55903:147-1451(+)
MVEVMSEYHVEVLNEPKRCREDQSSTAGCEGHPATASGSDAEGCHDEVSRLESAPESQFEVSDWTKYCMEIGWQDSPRDGHVLLPFSPSAAVSAEDCLAVRRWVKMCSRRYVPGTWLINLSAISYRDLEEITGWELPPDSSCRGRILRAAVSHFREQIDVANRRTISSSKHLQRWGRSLFFRPVSELQFELEASLGIYGFSFGKLFAESILGPTGFADFRRALRDLRQAACTPEGIDALSFDDCLSLTSGNEALAKLAFLARDNVKCDMQGHLKGEAAEVLLEDVLLESGIQREEFLTEAQLRDIQMRLFTFLRFPTPDILFLRPVFVQLTETGSTTQHPIRWIDMKDTIVVAGCTLNTRARSFSSQLSKYIKLFGEGAVLWRRGWAHSLQAPESVSFWRCLEVAGEDAAEPKPKGPPAAQAPGELSGGLVRFQ